MDNEDQQRLTELAESLVSGLFPSVSEAEFDGISKVLQTMKNAAISSGDVEKVMRIQAAASKIKPKSRNSHLPQIKKPISVEQKTLDDKLTTLLAGERIDTISAEVMPALASLCKARMAALSRACNFQEAERIKIIYFGLLSYLSERRIIEGKSKKLASCYNCLQKADDSLEVAKISCEDDVLGFDVESNMALKLIKEQMDEEIHNFDSKISADIPQSFIKFSSKLINLKETEKFLNKSLRFAEAAAVHEEVKALEEKELSELRKMYRRTVNNQRNRLVENQQRKIECLKEKMSQRREELRQKRHGKVVAAERAVENIQSRIAGIDSKSCSQPPSRLPSCNVSPRQPIHPIHPSPPSFYSKKRLFVTAGDPRSLSVILPRAK